MTLTPTPATTYDRSATPCCGQGSPAATPAQLTSDVAAAHWQLMLRVALLARPRRTNPAYHRGPFRLVFATPVTWPREARGTRRRTAARAGPDEPDPETSPPSGRHAGGGR
jgi:hypothetical protein